MTWVFVKSFCNHKMLSLNVFALALKHLKKNGSGFTPIYYDLKMRVWS